MQGHHVTPVKDYNRVILILLVLTVLTVVVAKPVSGFDLGILNTFVAMLIASVKAGLVLAIFMGLKHSPRLYLALTMTAVFFLVVMFSFSYLDIITRVTQQSTL